VRGEVERGARRTEKKLLPSTHPDHPDQAAPRVGRQLGAVLAHQARPELGEDGWSCRHGWRGMRESDRHRDRWFAKVFCAAFFLTFSISRGRCPTHSPLKITWRLAACSGSSPWTTCPPRTTSSRPSSARFEVRLVQGGGGGEGMGRVLTRNAANTPRPPGFQCAGLWSVPTPIILADVRRWASWSGHCGRGDGLEEVTAGLGRRRLGRP